MAIQSIICYEVNAIHTSNFPRKYSSYSKFIYQYIYIYLSLYVLNLRQDSLPMGKQFRHGSSSVFWWLVAFERNWVGHLVTKIVRSQSMGRRWRNIYICLSFVNCKLDSCYSLHLHQYGPH